MCILFVFTAIGEGNESDYSFILASNRDEYYDRPAAKAEPWTEDPDVIGGRDMEKGREGGTWLALSPKRLKLGVLLNLSGSPKLNPKGRGNIVGAYVKSEIPVEQYVKTLEPHASEYNDFNMVTAEFNLNVCKVQSYSNVTNILQNYDNQYLGFGNSLPETQLKKVVAGNSKFQDVCRKWNKVEDKKTLVDNLINLLKWDQRRIDFPRSNNTLKRHLPDPELERRCPNTYESLSSVYVNIPEGRYGTRTHTVILVTKTGHIDFYESTMLSPIDPKSPNWQNSEYHYLSAL